MNYAESTGARNNLCVRRIANVWSPFFKPVEQLALRAGRERGK